MTCGSGPGFVPVPFYCEENVWLYLDSLRSGGFAGVSLGDVSVDDDGSASGAFALFVSNAARRVAFFAQSGSVRGEALLWDYHVVALLRGGSGFSVVDFNCAAGESLPLECWLGANFGPLADLDERTRAPLSPRFRLVPARDYLAGFRSDRSHMRAADGSWLAPPPPWPCIGEAGSNLMAYVDMEGEAEIGRGRVMGMEELRRMA